MVHADAARVDASIDQELAALKRATAHLHRFENAAPGGWNLQVTDCLEHPTEGGMGYHFADLERYLDGEINPWSPRYSSTRPGRMAGSTLWLWNTSSPSSPGQVTRMSTIRLSSRAAYDSGRRARGVAAPRRGLIVLTGDGSATSGGACRPA